MLYEQKFLPVDSKPYWGKMFKDCTPESITIHWVGEYPYQTPEVVRKWWLESGGEVSAHFIVKDGIVLHTMPSHLCCHHTGSFAGNTTSLGIEVIPMNKEGEFSIMTKNTLRELLSLLPPLPLYRHYDWSEKPCPKFYIDEVKWLELKKYISPVP